ncbi:hypothetical protein L1987_33307 [Smallanthus sonchifolius]|uniref:Uncharacterized protein n=1 Tax=Smallanthus sonchifolius TaxID=185202 RepID=A0ACB9HS30_9ASTR|nr:hypothetical protein L1987_33307 [Smallanthus sonchifolius]
MRDLIGIKMSTLSEMVKQIKKEVAEELKASSPHQSLTRKDVSSPSSQQTPSPRREYSTPYPQRITSTPSSFRKKSLAKKKEKPESSHGFMLAEDLRKIVSLGIDRFNDSERVRLLLQALKKKGFSVYEEKEKEEEPLEVIPTVSCELLGKTESTQGDEDEEKKGQYFGNEDDPDSSDVGESLADNEVPLAQSQTLISEWYYDQELKKFVIKRLDFTFSTFSELVDLSVLFLAELKLLSLMPMSSTTEEDGNYELRRETRAVENFNSFEIVCLDVRLMLNLAELPMGNKEMDEKASNIEKTIKEFCRAYKEANNAEDPKLPMSDTKVLRSQRYRSQQELSLRKHIFD